MINNTRMISKAYRHTKRYIQIAQTFAKHGFADIITHSGFIDSITELAKLIKIKKNETEIKLTRYERIRLVLEDLGTTFIKLGQIMSNRGDLIPEELLVELEKLQDSVKPVPYEEIIERIEKEFKKPISQIFKSFSNKPLATASISQVHRAVLNSGEEVVIKVLKPNISKTIKVDIEIMYYLATLIEKNIPELSSINILGIVEEFNRAINKELDFSYELVYMTRFNRYFKNYDLIRVPKVYRDYSTNKILTMEYVDGIKISDIKKIEENNLDRLIIAKNGADLILKQIFEFGFFHADPHPGNIVVLKNNVICFFDYGMMGSISKDTKKLIVTILIGIIKKDDDKIIKNLLLFVKNKKDLNISVFELQVKDFIEKHLYRDLSEMNISELLNDFMTLTTENKIRIPSDFYLLLRALVLFQRNGQKLNPEFNFIEFVKPYIKKFLKENLSPKKLAEEIFITGSEYINLIRELPTDTRNIIEMLKKGEMNINVDHHGFEDMQKTHEQISNRISFAIVLASMVIGSSLILHSKIPPLFNDVSIIGIAGFIGAGVLGFWLLISILRHGKM